MQICIYIGERQVQSRPPRPHLPPAPDAGHYLS